MIIKFKTFENNYSIVDDPFDEEDWNDELNIEDGDMLRCIKNYSTVFIKGKLYKAILGSLKSIGLTMENNKQTVFFMKTKNRLSIPYIYDYFEKPNK